MCVLSPRINIEHTMTSDIGWNWDKKKPPQISHACMYRHFYVYNLFVKFVPQFPKTLVFLRTTFKIQEMRLDMHQENILFIVPKAKASTIWRL